MKVKGEFWLKVLGIHLIIALLTELSCNVMAQNGISNHHIYNAYMIFEYITLSAVILTIENSKRKIKGLISLILFTIFIGIYFLTKPSDGSFASLTLIIGGLFLAVQALLVMLDFALNGGDTRMSKNYKFWILASITFYFLTFIPVFGLFQYTLNSKSSFDLQKINLALSFVRYSLIFIGMGLIYVKPK